jgi:glycosyltransferase involved in cell wall biosynthesis
MIGEIRSIDMDASIVIPIKDEAQNIAALAQEITHAMESGAGEWECVWIDDGSSDQSLAILKELHQRDARHRFISFAVNSGQSAAFCAGFHTARGSVIATIDGDGQNDPADLPRMISMVQDGVADMVNGYRQKRRDSALRRQASRIANGARNFFTGKTVRDVGCSTRAFRRECVAGLPRFAGMHRFIPTLAAMEGFTLAEVPVNHRPRKFGESKYSIQNRLWVGLADLFGVFWLQKRSFKFKITDRSKR